MKTPEEIKRLRARMIEHLEAALAVSDEIGDALAGYLIERTLDQARSDQWPAHDPRTDVPPKPAW